jgi:hypothetical protein
VGRELLKKFLMIKIFSYELPMVFFHSAQSSALKAQC